MIRCNTYLRALLAAALLFIATLVNAQGQALSDYRLGSGDLLSIDRKSVV